MSDEYVKKLEKFKEESGWSAMKLAVALGVHVATVISWLNGTYTPSDMAIEKIEKFFQGIDGIKKGASDE